LPAFAVAVALFFEPAWPVLRAARGHDRVRRDASVGAM
jgi:hypothetical protein